MNNENELIFKLIGNPVIGIDGLMSLSQISILWSTMKDASIFFVFHSNKWIGFNVLNFLTFMNVFVSLFTFSHLLNLIKKLLPYPLITRLIINLYNQPHSHVTVISRDQTFQFCNSVTLVLRRSNSPRARQLKGWKIKVVLLIGIE